VFKSRAELGGYFARVRESLTPGGLFVLDAWGGTESMIEDRETRKIDSERAFDGTKIPAFTYIWEQKRFNPVDHHAVCQIHFRLPGGAKLRRAFVYEWRVWTLPEMQELLHEAGFAASEVYVEGWDDDEDEADGVFRRRTHFENHEGWVAYVVGYS
jgi:cyclopropane fatty-acyl-phospholipid synthase-like methyltransferase